MSVGGRLLEVLLFEIGGRRHALRASAVREVVRAVSLLPLPRAPAIVEGVIDVRGAVVPVLDLRARLRLAPQALSPGDHLVLANAGRRLVALRVDRALDLVRVALAAVESAPRLIFGSETLAGVAKLEDGLVLIHDLERFLEQAEEMVLDRALAEVPLEAMR